MRRSKLEFIADILKLLSDCKPQKITHISQKLNINPASTVEIVDFMQKQQLIEKINISPKRQEFRLTERGKQVKDMFETIRQVVYIESEPREATPDLEIRRRNKKLE